MEPAESRLPAIPKRLLVINPNTNPAVTRLVRREADRLAGPATQITVVNPAAGPFSIESRSDREDAEPRVVEIIRATLDRPYDAYVMACFDDIAIEQARSMFSVPVVGTAEAGIAAARTVARRFSIITTVHSAVPTIQGLLDRYGAREICTVRAAGVGVAAAATRDADERIMEAVRAAIDEDGAEAVLLGSGGLTGKAETLAGHFPVPIIDGVAAAIRMADGLAALTNEHAGRHRPVAVP